MVPLKQKETVILFNMFLLEVNPLPPTSTINRAVLKPLERGFIMACLFLQQSTLWQVFTERCSTSPLQQSGCQGSIKLINGGREEEKVEKGSSI